MVDNNRISNDLMTLRDRALVENNVLVVVGETEILSNSALCGNTCFLYLNGNVSVPAYYPGR